MLTPLRFSGMYRITGKPLENGEDPALRRTVERVLILAKDRNIPIAVAPARSNGGYRDVYTKEDAGRANKGMIPQTTIPVGTVKELLDKQRFNLITGQETEKPQNYRKIVETRYVPVKGSASHSGIRISGEDVDRALFWAWLASLWPWGDN